MTLRRHGSLAAAVRAAAADAERSGAPRFVAHGARVAAGEPLALFANAGADDRFYWEHPVAARALASRGAAACIEVAGPGRFREAAQRAEALFAALHASGAGDGPLLLGGFAFADSVHGEAWRGFPSGRLVLPEMLLTRSGDTLHATVTLAVGPGADVAAVCAALRARLDRAAGAAARRLPEADASEDAPAFRAAAERPLADYRARVAAALRAIANGELEKVVVARAVTVAHRAAHRIGFDAAALLDTLRRTHPSCVTFAAARRDAVFLCATPERLLRLDGRRIETAAVAGSAPRGRDPEEDARLARALRESKKEQAEHAIVVRALRAALGPRCDTLDVPEAPRLLRLEGIQHLQTPLRGTLRGDGTVLDLLDALHPTPAVGGAPREAALRWLSAHEPLDRGWYGGPVGFVLPDGGGEFSVALRAALLRGDEARLFAGAGIVAGSEPAAELRETRLKLRALLAPLLEI